MKVCAEAVHSVVNHESHLPWPAQYLVNLEGDSCCSAQCKNVSHVKSISHESYAAGAVFREVGG